MTYRMAIALTSLVNAIVALYLHLWKIGRAGTLACATGGCEIAQFSSYGYVFSGSAYRQDVALVGTIGWTVVFVAAVVGTLPRYEDDVRVTRLLAVLVGFGLLFTLRLKYGEFVVLRTFCPWCAINAGVVVVNSVLVGLDWRRLARRRAGAAPP